MSASARRERCACVVSLSERAAFTGAMAIDTPFVIRIGSKRYREKVRWYEEVRPREL